MSAFVDNILSMFTSSPLQIPTVEENGQTLTIEFSFAHQIAKDLPDDFPIIWLPTRDAVTIRWKDLNINDYENTDYLSSKDNWKDFKDGYTSSEDENISIKVEVNKRIVNNTLSVYDYEAFIDYLTKLQLVDFIHVIDGLVCRGCNKVEIQENTFASWHTDIMSFVNKAENAPHQQRVGKRDKKLELWKHSCRSNIQDIQLLPDDFYIDGLNSNDKLEERFHVACILLSLSYIANDTIYEDEKFYVHLSGYSVIDKCFNTHDIHIDDKNWNLYKIYQWVYENDQIYDKQNIARNILSLNAQSSILNLPEEVIGIMVNNHNIFVTENVDRFITVRNNISNFLLSYRSKVDETMSSYIDSMAHNILVIASFILTTIIVKAISKSGFDDFKIPSSILWIILVLIAVSGVQLYLNWRMISNKVPKYDKILANTRKQYQDILNDDELGILADADKDWEDKKCCVTCIWIATLLILAVADILFLIGYIG